MLALFAASADADPKKLSKELHGTQPSALVDVIVQFDPSNKTIANILKLRGQTKKEFRVFTGIALRLPANAAAALATVPGVKYVSVNRKVEKKLEFAEPGVFADIAYQNGYNGAGVGVAVIDSGVTPHGDLTYGGASRVVYSENFVAGTTSAADAYGHGTHVADIVAGDATQSTGTGTTRKFQGIAPRANIINLRVLDQNGSGDDIAVISAIDRAIELKSQYNIRVMNLSLGRPIRESYTLDPLCQAVERAWQAGIVVVVAAGNRGRDNSMNNKGYSTIGAPGNSPWVITVGAIKDNRSNSRADDRMASFRSKGPSLIDGVVKPDLVAS